MWAVAVLLCVVRSISAVRYYQRSPLFTKHVRLHYLNYYVLIRFGYFLIFLTSELLFGEGYAVAASEQTVLC